MGSQGSSCQQISHILQMDVQEEVQCWWHTSPLQGSSCSPWFLPDCWYWLYRNVITNGFPHLPMEHDSPSFPPWFSHPTNRCKDRFLVWGLVGRNIYMSQRDGFIDPKNQHKVCKLLKSLYGLKQSPCMWFERYNKCLLHLGFVPSTTDSNDYVKQLSSKFVLLGLYVDD